MRRSGDPPKKTITAFDKEDQPQDITVTAVPFVMDYADDDGRRHRGKFGDSVIIYPIELSSHEDDPTIQGSYLSDQPTNQSIHLATLSSPEIITINDATTSVPTYNSPSILIP